MNTKARAPALTRILAVDDEPNLRQLYLMILTRSGYRVETAEDGEAGWNAFRAAKSDPDGFDLLITDNSMPKLSGLELIRKLRVEELILPIIFASSMPPDDAESLNLSAILTKPFPSVQLVKVVEESLKNSNLARPHFKQLVRQLLTFEAQSQVLAKMERTECFVVYEKLRKPLSRLIGLDSYLAIVSRALALGAYEVPGLNHVQITTDGVLGCPKPTEFESQRKGGEVVLVAHIVGSMVNLIGVNLTRELLQDVWPEIELQL